jgi:hypothetical protein
MGAIVKLLARSGGLRKLLLGLCPADPAASLRLTRRLRMAQAGSREQREDAFRAETVLKCTAAVLTCVARTPEGAEQLLLMDAPSRLAGSPFLEGASRAAAESGGLSLGARAGQLAAAHGQLMPAVHLLQSMLTGSAVLADQADLASQLVGFLSRHWRALCAAAEFTVSALQQQEGQQEGAEGDPAAAGGGVSHALLRQLRATVALLAHCARFPALLEEGMEPAALLRYQELVPRLAAGLAVCVHPAFVWANWESDFATTELALRLLRGCTAFIHTRARTVNTSAPPRAPSPGTSLEGATRSLLACLDLQLELQRQMDDGEDSCDWFSHELRGVLHESIEGLLSTLHVHVRWYLQQRGRDPALAVLGELAADEHDPGLNALFFPPVPPHSVGVEAQQGWCRAQGTGRRAQGAGRRAQGAGRRAQGAVWCGAVCGVRCGVGRCCCVLTARRTCVALFAQECSFPSAC